MTDNGELHVVFGTGAVGMSVMDELVQRGPRRVRMVNRSGRARVPHGVEVVGGDATDEAFTREASEGASVVYFALNPPYNKWPELFPGLQAGVLEGAASAGAKLVAMENLYMYGSTYGRSPRIYPTRPTHAEVGCSRKLGFRHTHFSETHPAPVLLTQVSQDRTPLHRTGYERYSPSFRELPLPEGSGFNARASSSGSGASYFSGLLRDSQRPSLLASQCSIISLTSSWTR